MWEPFVSTVRGAILRGNFRQTLAHHTTDSNQLGKREGVVTAGSLQASGIDVVHETSNHKFQCKIALENLLQEDDGIPLNYVSLEHANHSEAEQAACVEILSYILFRSPGSLRHHERQWDKKKLALLRRYNIDGLRNGLGRRPIGQWSPVTCYAPQIPSRRRRTRGPADVFTADSQADGARSVAEPDSLTTIIPSEAPAMRPPPGLTDWDTDRAAQDENFEFLFKVVVSTHDIAPPRGWKPKAKETPPRLQNNHERAEESRPVEETANEPAANVCHIM